MVKKELTADQKSLNVDLWIIVITSLVVFGTYMVIQNKFISIMNDNNIHILLRVLFAFAFQFGIAGFGITIVAIMRKENLRTYGLQAKGAVLSIGLCVLCYVPNVIFDVITGGFTSYLPFQQVWTTKAVLASGFPTNTIGILLTATAWGFFEGFNYVVISDKINKRYPSKNRWFNWGAILCAVMCILIHGTIGVTAESIIEMLSIMLIIYGMLIVKNLTKNSWGCVFIFIFLWNAF